jgi:asparagine synthase (glutamine-hydrolysing)
MCGIVGIIGKADEVRIHSMVECQSHRGPDGQGVYLDPHGLASLGHNALRIIDLSPTGKQPMTSADSRYVLVFNGEIYNYKELKEELRGYPFRGQSDSEVILAAFERWGEACVDHFIGMFAILLWDEKEQKLFAARDRFGVKPLYYATSEGLLFLASEIKSLHAAGIGKTPNEQAWAKYLSFGTYDDSDQTFWEGIQSLPAGHLLVWHKQTFTISCWYDLAERVHQHTNTRSVEDVSEEYFALLCESIALRFRSDVPVGITLSGGLDSSVLLGLVDYVHPSQKDVQAYTFVTGDSQYDESPWVEQMLQGKEHPWHKCLLSASDVPQRAREVQDHQDEPFGGIPTLAYAGVFREARKNGTIVLLDGQGMDEQWAGYDYYAKAVTKGTTKDAAVVQGSKHSAVHPECLTADFAALAKISSYPEPFPDVLRNLQYRDTRYTKIPRALRFSDRVSMQSSTELREPFLDHRLFELAFSQPADRKIHNGTGKWLLREIAKRVLPNGIAEAPKRAVQTPQREWLSAELRPWAEQQIQLALESQPGTWLDREAVERTWQEYLVGKSDNSFYVWQWITMGLMFGK